MGRSLGNMKRMCDLRWSGKGLQESYFHAFIIMEKKKEFGSVAHENNGI